MVKPVWGAGKELLINDCRNVCRVFRGYGHVVRRQVFVEHDNRDFLNDVRYLVHAAGHEIGDSLKISRLVILDALLRLQLLESEANTCTQVLPDRREWAAKLIVSIRTNAQDGLMFVCACSNELPYQAVRW